MERQNLSSFGRLATVKVARAYRTVTKTSITGRPIQVTEWWLGSEYHGMVSQHAGVTEIESMVGGRRRVERVPTRDVLALEYMG